MLDDKLDLLLYEKFVENVHDQTEVLSSDDRFVLKKYECLIENISNRYKIGLPFKNKCDELPNNYTNALQTNV